MSPTSPIPVLRGSGGAVLRAEGDALVLTRGDTETWIPFRAVRRVRAEGGTAAVELTAPTGAEPAVHRVDGVSGAAVAVFADMVNAALPARGGEEAGEEAADGAALVGVRPAAGSPPESPAARKTRVFRIWLGSVVLLGVVLTAAVWLVAPASVALPLLVVVPFGAALTTAGHLGLKVVHREWYLPRKGITVEAVRRDGTTDRFGATGNYVYTDLHGQSRVMYAQRRAEAIRIAYHPLKPGTAAVCQTLPRLIGGAVAFAAVLLAGLAVDGAAAGLVFYAFRGEYG
ncbi:hypothetical protein ACFY9C_09230 [Streptomyces filamentosus]|uniref:hypothetical protein n=1 Tax=Streptomyces filamentosus TaxID=67294 RepID=UPI0036F12F2A